MDFGAALKLLKQGLFVQRHGWHGKCMMVGLQRCDYRSKMTEPYLFLVVPDQASGGDAPDRRIPWTISQEDALAEDWQVVS
jgi:Protein of unknown function (DUF2829)